MNNTTQRRIGLAGVVTLLAAALLAINVPGAGAATSTSQLERAPFVAAGTPPGPAPIDGGSLTAITPVVAAENPVLARAPFAAVPIVRTAAVAESSAAANAGAGGLDPTARAALGAPAPGPLVVNAAPLSSAAGLAILGGSLLAVILISGATMFLTYGRYRPQAEFGSAVSIAGLGQRRSERDSQTDQSSRRRAA